MIDEQKEQKRPRSRVKKGTNSTKYITVAIILLFVTSFILYLRMHSTATEPHPTSSQLTTNKEQKTLAQSSDQTSLQSDNESTSQGKHKPPHTGDLAVRSGQGSSSASDTSTSPEIAHPEGTAEYFAAKSELSSATKLESKGEDSQSTVIAPPSTIDATTALQVETDEPAPSPRQIEQITAINTFYSHLDQQPYIKELKLTEPSKVHFSSLLQKLVDNPPVVVRETDDLFTLLQNTAHFFRVLGKNNINTLKSILSNEKDSFELTLLAFYGLTAEPQQLEKEYALSITPHVLTDYASFFLNTMGGRLYLFRRDSASRMLVSYYAIMTIHRANQAGDGGHGIDLRPAIDNLVDDIEYGGKRLQLKDQYLDVLYDLQEIYN